MKAGYYWVKTAPDKDWEIAKTNGHGFFFFIGWDWEVREEEVFKIGSKIPEYAEV